MALVHVNEADTNSLNYASGCVFPLKGRLAGYGEVSYAKDNSSRDYWRPADENAAQALLLLEDITQDRALFVEHVTLVERQFQVRRGVAVGCGFTIQQAIVACYLICQGCAYITVVE